MAKKKTDKETEPKKISKNRFTTFFKSETTHFVIGLISVIFSVYLLLAFISFFFTGAADQSILDNQQPGELMQTTNHVKNYEHAVHNWQSFSSTNVLELPPVLSFFSSLLQE